MRRSSPSSFHLKSDVIVTVGDDMTRKARDVTSTIPYFATAYASSPVETGLVQSLPRPGGNVTGANDESESPSWR